MFKIHEIRELIRMIDQSSINEFKMDHEGTRIVLRKQPKGQAVSVVTAPMPQVQQTYAVEAPQVSAPQAVQQGTKAEQIPASQPKEQAKTAEVNDPNLHKIKSPMVGTFYRRPAPDADAFVNPGDMIQEKTVVCIVEAMKLFNEIEADVKGEIVEVLVEDGQLVEYGQPLFLVKQK